MSYPGRIDWKVMMHFIKGIGRSSIPQTMFYRLVHQAHPGWEVPQIARCLRFLKEGGYIDIGTSLEIIPLFLSDPKWDLLDSHEEEMEGKWVGKGDRTCPNCHSANIKNVMFGQGKCMECGLTRIRKMFDRDVVK